jgi:hypothetical protein
MVTKYELHLLVVFGRCPVIHRHLCHEHELWHIHEIPYHDNPRDCFGLCGEVDDLGKVEGKHCQDGARYILFFVGLICSELGAACREEIRVEAQAFVPTAVYIADAHVNAGAVPLYRAFERLSWVFVVCEQPHQRPERSATDTRAANPLVAIQILNLINAQT